MESLIVYLLIGRFGWENPISPLIEFFERYSRPGMIYALISRPAS